MRLSVFAAALLPFLSDLATALPSVLDATAPQTFTVMVGGGGTTTYNPTTVNASIGDTIAFQFVAKNHTVTQSNFTDPCLPMAGGIDSGFNSVPANATTFPEWSFNITDTTPLWFYCRQVGHCQMGMVFAVNPTATKTFQAFQNAAMAGGNGSSSASPSGSSTTSPGGSSVASGSSSSTASPAASPNGALSLGGSAAGLLTAVGLVAGLML